MFHARAQTLTQRGLRYPQQVELGQPVAFGYRHGRRQLDAVSFLPGPTLVRGRPVVAGRPGRAAHGLQVASPAHFPVLEPLVVRSTEYGTVPDAEIVAFAQHCAARVAREALDVVDKVLGPHDQVARADAALTAGAAFHREQPVRKRQHSVMLCIGVRRLDF